MASVNSAMANNPHVQGMKSDRLRVSARAGQNKESRGTRGSAAGGQPAYDWPVANLETTQEALPTVVATWAKLVNDVAHCQVLLSVVLVAQW